MSTSVRAATINKTNNTDDLNLTTSWTGGAVPGTNDIAQWTSVVTGTNSTLLGADLSWGGIKIVGPGGPVTIGGANTLTLGTSGIDLSTATASLTLNCGLTLRNTGSQSWKAAAGRTLNVAGTFTRTGTQVDFTSFNATATLSGLTNDASGILGPWATTGSDTTLNYVQNTAGAISTYTGQTIAISNDMSNVNSANVNYSLDKPVGGAILTGPITGNTLRVTSTSDNAIANAGNSITLNGLICVGANRAIISGTGNLVIGSTRELVINWTKGFSSITCPVVENPGDVSSVTLYVKPQSGDIECSFGAAGVTGIYNGGTTINYPTGGQLNYHASSFGSGPITLNGGAIRFRYLSGPLTNSLTINCIGGSLYGGTFTGPITLNTGTVISSGAATISGNVSGSGGFNVNAAGTHLFSGTNTYTGPTTISLGTLKAGIASVPNVSGAFGLNSAVTMANAATALLDLNGYDTQIGSLAGGGTTGGNVTNSHATTSATLTVGGDNTSTAYAGDINGPRLGLTKIGTGTLTLGNTNTYSGVTQINAGTLKLNNTGSIDSTNIIIASGATLDVTNQATYVMGPANTYSFGFNVAGTGTVGRIIASGLDISSARVSFVGLTNAPSRFFVIASYNSLAGTTFASVEGLHPSFSINYNYKGWNQIALVGAVAGTVITIR